MHIIAVTTAITSYSERIEMSHRCFRALRWGRFAALLKTRPSKKKKKRYLENTHVHIIQPRVHKKLYKISKSYEILGHNYTYLEPKKCKHLFRKPIQSLKVNLPAKFRHQLKAPSNVSMLRTLINVGNLKTILFAYNYITQSYMKHPHRGEESESYHMNRRDHCYSVKL